MMPKWCCVCGGKLEKESFPYKGKEAHRLCKEYDEMALAKKNERIKDSLRALNK